MFTSPTITKLIPALLAAQKKMGAAIKGSKNPYYKSSYADLGAVLEACKELLNENGVVILQPHGRDAFGTYVETTLLHESGEYISSVTPVVFAKEGDPQAQGSAITYARRYGLQSLLSMPAEDDDGEKAMARKAKTETKGQPAKVAETLPVSNTAPQADKPKTTFRKPKVEPEPLSNGSTDDLGLN